MWYLFIGDGLIMLLWLWQGYSNGPILCIVHFCCSFIRKRYKEIGKYFLWSWEEFYQEEINQLRGNLWIKSDEPWLFGFVSSRLSVAECETQMWVHSLIFYFILYSLSFPHQAGEEGHGGRPGDHQQQQCLRQREESHPFILFMIVFAL